MTPTDLSEDTRLPAAVLDLAVRIGASTDSRGVRFKQNRRTKANLAAASWMPFTATQTISTRACAFDWVARAGPFGVISARDALAASEGRLDVTALGVIPIARTAHTPALVHGELMRYLAELAWAPDAILATATLRRREDGPDRLIVGAGVGAKAAEVTLTLDRDGRIASTFAPDRPRSSTEPILPTPRRGRFSDYRQHLGRWLPFAGEVAWEFDGRAEVYWQGRIEQWDVVARKPA